MKAQYAAEYADIERWHWWFRGRQRILETILREECAGRTPLDVLSVGCGPAEGLNWLLPLAGDGGRVIGVDADPVHARRPAPGPKSVVGRLEAMPLVSRSFDVVLGLDVLEHLDDDVAGLREAVRLVAPGGVLVVTVPALPSLWGRQDVINEHRRRYTRSTLYRLFARAGLPRPAISYFNTLLFPAVAAIRWTRRMAGLDDGGSDLESSHPGLANELLATVFATERHFVRKVPMPVGVSLLATLRC
jgi:SAM-dependent methyltransferase